MLVAFTQLIQRPANGTPAYLTSPTPVPFFNHPIPTSTHRTQLKRPTNLTSTQHHSPPISDYLTPQHITTHHPILPKKIWTALLAKETAQSLTEITVHVKDTAFKPESSQRERNQGDRAGRCVSGRRVRRWVGRECTLLARKGGERGLCISGVRGWVR